jgi:hypothetical protein
MTIMRKFVFIAAMAVLAAGCSSSEKDDVAATAVPASPPAQAQSGATDTPSADGGDYVPTAQDAYSAGMSIIMARDVCKLSSEDLLKFGEYGKRVVNDDPDRKAIYVMAARETAKLNREAMAQGKQEELKASACPRVRRMLAAIDKSGITAPKSDAVDSGRK